MKLTSNKELEKLISECKTPKELHRLQELFANEIIGRITDRQALMICRREDELEEKFKAQAMEVRNV